MNASETNSVHDLIETCRLEHCSAVLADTLDALGQHHKDAEAGNPGPRPFARPVRPCQGGSLHAGLPRQ